MFYYVGGSMADKNFIVDSIDNLSIKMKELKEAQKKFASYSQEQVDKIFYEVSMAANKARFSLAKMAVEETGMGVLEDKVIKNHYAAEYIYNAYKDTKTCGVIEEDKIFGIKKIAEPIGVIAAVIPTTKRRWRRIQPANFLNLRLMLSIFIVRFAYSLSIISSS